MTLPYKPESSDRILVARVLIALALLLAGPGRLLAQADSTPPVGFQFHFQTPPLVLQEPVAFRSPWLAQPVRSPEAAARAWRASVVASRDSVRRARADAELLRHIYGARVQVNAEGEQAGPRKGVLGLSSKYADLTIDGLLRLELRTDKLRNHRCNPAQLLDPNSGCRGGFKPPRLDTDLKLRAGGVIGQRFHIDIDYDTQRDFAGNNDVRLYYQGLEDEVVRQVQVGSVTFQAPPSRFLTAAVPANNFGINAAFEVGRVQLQTMVATQKGSSVVQRVYSVGSTSSQPVDQEVRDLDFEAGRFFWVPDPTFILGYPALDILNLNASGLPAALRPVDLRVYRSRLATSTGNNSSIGGITAIALGEDTTQRLTSQWELLVANRDYYVDASGLWFALASTVGPTDYVAVSYPTAAGGQVGTFPAVDRPVIPGTPPLDTLRLVAAPKVGPQNSPFRHEMRQIYRVGGSDLDRSTLAVNLSVNRSESPLKPGAAPSYLAQLGLATATDPYTFNQTDRLFPRARDPLVAQTVGGSFLVLPHLTPFADSTRLVAGEISDSLYRTPLFLLLTEGPPAHFTFRVRYNSVGGGDRSHLDLNALQIREGSEQLTLGGRVLQRDVDYTIAYAIGQVTFLDPDYLFQGGQGQVSVRFEEQTLFAVAPTQIYGLSSRYSLGDKGSVNLVGIYQVEKSAFNRPQLGFEASADLVGGISTDLHFAPSGVTRLLNKLTSRPATARSLLDLSGELAFTHPDPNRSGQAYLEEFEGDNGVLVSLRENLWTFGSQPQAADGVLDLFPFFNPADAVQMTWQNLVPDGRGGVVELQAADIDPTVQVTGSQGTRETALFMAFHADTAGGSVQFNNHSRWSQPRRDNAPRWRSMVTSLSTTGVDLSKNEFLEFWVFQDSTLSADSAGLRLMLDLGSVNEDATAIGPESLLVVPRAGGGVDTVFTGRRALGLNRLDSERDPLTGTFNAAVNDVGILGDRLDTLQTVSGPVLGFPFCQDQLSNSVQVFPWGDLSGRCTNGNGTLDTEDQNGDNQLNAAGANDNVFRWVVDLKAGDFFVRDGVRTGRGGWKLYRIPLRTPEFKIGGPSIRLINSLRLTVVAPSDGGLPDIVGRFALGRMRFLGSPWARRSDTPIAGLEGAQGLPHGEVIASTISTENVELGYTSPPGVVAGVDQKNTNPLGVQINERSLRVIGRQLGVGERAEAYLRFPNGPQNLLRYRQLRFWAKGAGTGWEEGDFKVFLKLGSDSRNFYQFISAVHSNPAQSGWLPELSVDLDVWRDLRSQIETRYLLGQAPDSAERVRCGGDPLSPSYVTCSADGRYVVNVGDPGISPPNLAAVQEMAAGAIRVGSTTGQDSAEVWVDEIRLVEPISKVGTALALDARLVASDVGDVSLGYVRQDGFFQQIGQDPTYRTTGTLHVGTNWRADRFLPASLGIGVPISVNYTRASVVPDLLSNTDLQASRIVGLREPVNWSVSYSMGVRRTEHSRSPLIQAFVDPLALSAGFTHGRNRTDLQDASSSAFNLLLGYGITPRPKTVKLGLGGLIDRLPGFLKRTDGADGARSGSLNLTPTNLRMSSGLARSEGELVLYTVPVARPQDALLPTIQSLSYLWRNNVGLSWQPLGMLRFSGDLTSTRDLRHYSDSTSLGRLAGESRRSLFGLDVGVERDRTLSTSLILDPRLTSWLHPRYVRNSSFVLSRSLTSRDPVRSLDDSTGAFILPQTLNNLQGNEYGVALDLDRLLNGLRGQTAKPGQSQQRLRPFDISNRTDRSSTFDLAVFNPDLGYQLAMGGLDGFLQHKGQTALAATETRATTISGGATLPLGFSLSTSYSRIRSSRFQRLGSTATETESLQREWPAGALRWSRTLRHTPVASIALGTTYRRRVGTAFQFDVQNTQTGSSTRSTTVSPDATLILRNGVALTFQYNRLRQLTQSVGNSTESAQSTLNGTLNYAFRLPTAISKLRKLARFSFASQRLQSSSCLRQAGAPACRSFSDSRRTEFRAGLDSDLLTSVTGGLQFAYSLNEVPSLNQRLSQTIITATLQVSLFAGDYR